ncbi:hypothetical protein [Zymomonas mobilis]|uniref:hypothetical protein n=1 Tax=Zymomonas mobilis TaxID=542 RepID=UPI0039EAB74B
MMAAERLLSYNPVTGLKSWFSSSEENHGSWHIRYEQDCSAALEANKQAQNEDFDRRSSMWHAAHVPAVVLMEWLVKYGVRYWDKNHAPAVRRLLNHPDYRYLRVNHFIM